MSRRFTLVSVALAGVVSFLVGAIVAGGFGAPPVVADVPAARTPGPGLGPATPGLAGSVINFADVVERINPAVVGIDATARGDVRRRRGREGAPGGLDPFEGQPRGDRGSPRRGAGSGFIIDPDGSILTNHHVIDRAERITVTLSDGRTLLARVVGTDPDSDIALIKVDGQKGLPVAALGDSATLRMGEWVCAIGNPLGYEHSVTVGVVSFVGRKLFDASLDNYIQTDAAINFGNSGGPLINARGEVIGINAAISSRASNIGFAVPISSAAAILPQLKADGRVSRGYIGVGLRDVDDDLQRSLNLPVGYGALIQDVTKGSPAERAGLKPYDVVVEFDAERVANDEELIQGIASRAPGTSAAVRVVRNGREQGLTVKLAERPARQPPGQQPDPAPPAERRDDGALLGLNVRDLDAAAFNRFDLPPDTRGVLITRVEPLSSSFDAEILRGTVLLEINRRAVTSAAEFQRIAAAAQPGDVLTLYLYAPETSQRQLKTITVEAR